jgi:hypothetical protein
MSSILASDILGGPPAGAVAFVNMIDWGRVAWTTDTNVVVWGEKRRWEEALVDVEIALAEEFDPLGMFDYGLKVLLAKRLKVPVSRLSAWTSPEGVPQFRGHLNGHRYISRTDRLCKKLGFQMEPGEVATWRCEEGAWELGNRQGSTYRVSLDAKYGEWLKALDLAEEALA